MIPVHPDDRLLLGMQWENDIFVDKTLPFRLSSAPLLSLSSSGRTAIYDAEKWGNVCGPLY